MRLWLDEMIPVAVAVALRRQGFDVQGAQEPKNAWTHGLDDQEQLVAATRQRCALVTYNIPDFIHIAQAWAAEGQEHCGVVLVHEKTVPARDPGRLIRALAALLREHPSPEALRNQVVFLRRP